MKLEITEGRPFHCGQIARLMRVEHHRLLLGMNVPIHQDLRRMFDGSYYRRAAFIDGALAAIWGVESTPICSDGRVWLVLAQHAIKYPMTIIRQARRELTHLAETKTHLFTTVIADDEPAIRLAIALGFQGNTGSWEGMPAHSREGRGRLMRYLRSNPELLVWAGSAQLVGIVWRREAQAMTDLPVAHADLVLPAMSDSAIEKVRRLEQVFFEHPQVPIFTGHLLHAGTYCRTIMIPAGVAITGVLVKVPTVLIAQGEATIFIGDAAVEVSGYNVVPAQAGRKQAFLARTDFVLTMMFPTSARTVEEAEHEFTDEFDLLASHRDERFNHTTITGE